MTVAELIAALQLLPQDLPVKLLDTDTGDYMDPLVPYVVNLYVIRNDVEDEQKTFVRL